ncbi:MAG TPA: hypothetical protein VEA69_04420 [Tepidisphaeraceae bacterium]|nr:hypothetical protein [Tepidisphaeraceae bacterium]
MSNSVTVDHQSMPVQEMGFETVGQVLAHLQKDNRLVVHVLIDGREPDLAEMGDLRRTPLRDHTLFVETADPRQLAGNVLKEVEEQLAEADRLRAEASELIVKGQNQRAMEKLSGCFTTWQHAQESVLKTAQLVRLDLQDVIVDGRPLSEMVGEFAGQLRSIKVALENRDFVGLNDILTYEAAETSDRWRRAVGEVGRVIGGLR